MNVSAAMISPRAWRRLVALRFPRLRCSLFSLCFLNCFRICWSETIRLNGAILSKCRISTTGEGVTRIAFFVVF